MRRNNLTAALLAVFLSLPRTGEISFIAQAGEPGPKRDGNKQLLKGEIGSTARFSGSVRSSPLGFEAISTSGKSTITRVTTGTEAWARGLQPGDTVVDEKALGGTVSVTIERGGKRYQANLAATGSAPGSAPPTFPALRGDSALQQRLAVLSNHNVAMIIDKSGSMATRDCPGNISRWNWCGEQTRTLTAATSGCGCLKDGITIVVFSEGFSVYNNATVKQISEIFADSYPDGTTGTGDALQSQIDAYFLRKSRNPDKTAPAVIAVVTDGEPNKPEQVRQVIIDATRRMTDPNELSITFLQVGAAPWGAALLHELDDNLVNEGAVYDIVDTKSFTQLERIGLIGALAEAITALRTPSAQRARHAAATASASRAQQQYRRPASNSRTVRQANQYSSSSAPPAVPLQQQLKRAEQERSDLERKLLEN